MLRICVIVLAALLAPVAALVTPTTPPSGALANKLPDDKIMRTISRDDVSAILTSHGLSPRQSEVNSTALAVTTSDGVPVHIFAMTCDATGTNGCRDMLIIARVDLAIMQLVDSGGKGPAQPATFEKINYANMDFPMVATSWSPKTNILIVSRYLLLDGGLTVANIKAEFDNLVRQAKAVNDRIAWPNG